MVTRKMMDREAFKCCNQGWLIHQHQRDWVL